MNASLQSIQALIEAIREHNAIFSRKDPIPLREAAWNDMARAALNAEASLKQLLADNSWIPCSERLPDKEGLYLVWTSNMGSMFAHFDTYSHADVLGTSWSTIVSYQGSSSSYGDRMELKWVTHWRVNPPGPSAPETTEEGVT